MLEKKHLQEGIDFSINFNLLKHNDSIIYDRILIRQTFWYFISYWISGLGVLRGDDSQREQLKPDLPFRHQKATQNFAFEHKPKAIKFVLKINIDQLEECAERNHSYQKVRRQYEQEKNIWIQRFWQTSSQDISTIQVQQSGRTNPHSRLLQSKTRQATTINRRENETPKISIICLGEFPAACEGRQYDQIDRILYAIWNRQRHGSTQLENSDSRRIERLIQVVAQYFSINKALGFTPATEGGKADA